MNRAHISSRCRLRARGLALAAAFVAALVASANAPAATVFVFTGRGWGHGIGLSQYGTAGFAEQGWTHADILKRYYTGAAVTGGFPNPVVKVLLASARPSVVVASDAAFTLAGDPLAAGSYTVTPGNGTITVARTGFAKTVASPGIFSPDTAPLKLGGVAYRGDLIAASSVAGTSLSVLNTVRRESYLRGVVPREMPSSWHAEALKAQAVAARSYAIAVGGHCSWPVTGEPVLCADVRDQVYGGVATETAATKAAVQATAGEVVTYGGEAAATYFFSTSGGKTATKADEWGGLAVPYLVSVADPYDTVSPHHFWGPQDAETDCAGTSPDCVFTAAQVQDRLGLAAPLVDVEVTARNGSSRVATLTMRTAITTSTFNGAAARTGFGLRSTWFYVGVLGLTRSAATVTYGGGMTLFGLTRSGGTSGWGIASLQQRRYGEIAWTAVLTPLPNGSWSSRRTPRIATDFRVVSGNAVGPAHRVYVRTSVTAKAPGPPYTRVTGSIEPAKRDVAVTLERRRNDGTWTLVARKTTNAQGGFAFSVTRPGTYRARADAGAGYLAGARAVTIPAA